MSVECRDWMNEIAHNLQEHGIEFSTIPDDIITEMYWNDLSVEQAVNQILTEKKEL